MRNIARRIALSLSVAFLVGLTYLGPVGEAGTVLAKDSQDQIQKLNTEIFQITDLKLEREVNGYSAAPAGLTLAADDNKGLTFRATAYCLRGKTASGKYVRRGLVAADPRVLPLGTRISMAGGRYTGKYLVADTGKKIKGRRLDIWVPSCKEAMRWGIRTVKVRVLSRRR